MLVCCDCRTIPHNPSQQAARHLTFKTFVESASHRPPDERVKEVRLHMRDFINAVYGAVLAGHVVQAGVSLLRSRLRLHKRALASLSRYCQRPIACVFAGAMAAYMQGTSFPLPPPRLQAGAASVAACHGGAHVCAHAQH